MSLVNFIVFLMIIMYVNCCAIYALFYILRNKIKRI